GQPDEPASAHWQEVTAHLGVRFVPDFAGPGLKIRDVLPTGPADQKKSLLRDGEIVLSIDGTPVDRTTELTKVLNGPLARDMQLKVGGADGKDREVAVRPISYNTVRALLYRQWINQNRQMVEQKSGGKLGYLHIDAMSMPSFYKFESELYAVGA